MKFEQWQRVEEVLHEALALPAGERYGFASQACEGNEELSREVVSLIDAFHDSGDFLETPALETDAEVLFSLGDNNIGREIGPYLTIERLGVGGMGEVYLAKDLRLDRSVALKILPNYFSDEIRLSRFRKEARAASALNHPNIITIHEVGQHEDVRFIATEFIEGVTLRELLSQGTLSTTDALEISEQVCAALSAAHSAGIVHRDIKPENVMRRPDGFVKLLDFGIAKLVEPSGPGSSDSQTQTEMGVVMGTVNYMSPEQARGVTVDERSDIWSLGVVLYEMLSGRLPFTRPNRMDTLVAILERDAEPLFGKDNELQQLLDKCLAKDAGERFQSSAELLEAIRRLKSSAHDFSLTKSLPGEQTEHPTLLLAKPRSRRWLWLVGVLLIVGLGAVGYWRLSMRRTSVPPATPKVETVATKLYSAMTNEEQLAFIDQQEQRISALLGERSTKLNPEALQAIKQRVDRYVARTPDSDPLPVLFGRAIPYQRTIGRSFRERNVPVIIGVYLPMIESAYKPCYENPYGSKGLYQFTPGTAVLYGVPKDQMCDAEKMTPAAAHYIADRIAELGDDSQSLTLVILSYTTGPEWVREVLRKLRANGHYDRTFWTMFDNRDLLGEQFKKEIIGYVPAFFAAAIVGENPDAFGLGLPPLTTLAAAQ